MTFILCLFSLSAGPESSGIRLQGVGMPSQSTKHEKDSNTNTAMRKKLTFFFHMHETIKSLGSIAIVLYIFFNKKQNIKKGLENAFA